MPHLLPQLVLNSFIKPFLGTLLFVGLVDVFGMLVLDMLNDEILTAEAFGANLTFIFLTCFYLLAFVPTEVLDILRDEFLGRISPHSSLLFESHEG